MSLLEFLADLRRRGIEVSAEEDRLRVNAPRGVLTPGLQAEIADRKPEILDFLRQAQRAADGTPARLVRTARAGDLPLSPGQQGLWNLVRLAPYSPVYNLHLALRLSGPLHRRALERSLGEICRRHEILRTVFPAGEAGPVQVIEPPRPCPLAVVDLRRRPAPRRRQDVWYQSRRQAREAFDVERGPLWRVLLLCLGPREHVLLVTMHHLISDGWSFQVLLDELACLYRAFCRGEPCSPTDLPLQYADVAAWRREWLQSPEASGQRHYWQGVLAGARELVLPFDQDAVSRPSHRAGVCAVRLDSEEKARLHVVGRRERVTPFVVLLAAWKALLHRTTGQEDVLVCTPVAGRDEEEVKDLIGYFNNVVAVRTRISPSSTFADLLRRVGQAVLEAHEHRHLPFQQWTELPGLARVRLARGLFVYHQGGGYACDLPDIEVQVLDIDHGYSDFDLALTAEERADGLRATLKYRMERFQAATVEALLEGWRVLLQDAVRHPARRLEGLPGAPIADHGGSARADGREERSPPDAERVCPRDELEERLAAIWEAVLEVGPVGVRDDFFELGGNSLLALRLFARIERAFRRRLPAATLYHAPTVAQQAALLRESQAAWTSLVTIQPDGHRPPFFFVPPAGASLMHLFRLGRYLAPDQPFYGLQPQGLQGEAAPHTRCEEMARHYLVEVTAAQPHGPYLLGGGCTTGSRVAFEMAQQLEARGEPVALLLLVDDYGFRFGGIRGRSLRRGMRALRDGQLPRALGGRLKSGARRLVRRISAAARLLAAGAEERRVQRVTKAHIKAANLYRSSIYSGRITLLWSAEYAAHDRKDEWVRRWAALAGGGIEEQVLSGGHDDMYDEPHVGQLAEILRACIDRALSAP